jgi:signal transduction histidine kinase
VGSRRRWWPLFLFVPGAGATAIGIAVLAAAGAGSGHRWANWVNAWLVVLPALPIGWSFVAVGLFARWKRPDNRVGTLMTAVGFGQFASFLWVVPVSWVYTAGLVVAPWFVAVLVHLLLAYPSGSPSGRLSRALVAVGYLTELPVNLIQMLWRDEADSGPPGVHDLLLVRVDPGLADVLSLGSGVVLVAVLAATAAVLVHRRLRGTSAQRRALAPVLVVGALFAVMTALRLALPGEVGLLGLWLTLLAIPYAFLFGLARVRFFQMRTLSALMAGLGDARYGGDLPAAVADAFHDASVQTVYWLADRGRYVDQDGWPVGLPAEGSGRTVVPVERDGRRLGAIIVDSAAVADRSRPVTGLVAAVELAMDNRRLEAELRARVLQLEESRTRLVDAGDAQRRALERDLHDGAQQLLVLVRLRLGQIRQSLSDQGSTGSLDGASPPSADVGSQVETAMSDLDAALAELRELARGLHPVLLSTRGLEAAVRSLAARTLLPTHVEVRVREPLPEAVASAAYFVIAESLTNVIKHAAATRAAVTVVEQAGCVLIEVRDDGAGGADPTGSGFRGLSARVEALDGRLRVDGGAGGGTAVRAEIPLPAGAEPRVR